MTDKVIVKESRKEGKGIFALHDIKEGEIILEMDDSQVVEKDKVKELSEEDQNHTDYIGNGKYSVMKSPEKFINHSCDPNTFVKNRKVIAMKDIDKNEEITYDYSINGIDPWEMNCKCGSKNCRKIVYGDFRKLDAKTQKKYESYLEDWYKQEILKRPLYLRWQKI